MTIGLVIIHFRSLGYDWANKAIVNLEPKYRNSPCTNAIEAISGGFTWAETPEGHFYWADMVRAMEKCRSVWEYGGPDLGLDVRPQVRSQVKPVGMNKHLKILVLTLVVSFVWVLCLRLSTETGPKFWEKSGTVLLGFYFAYYGVLLLAGCVALVKKAVLARKLAKDREESLRQVGILCVQGKEEEADRLLDSLKGK